MSSPATIHVILFALASSSSDGMSSTLVARKIKNGNHKAFRSFFDEHYDALYRFLLSKNTSAETAKDLIQQAFIYIWENRNKIDPEKSLRSYIFRIAYTRMLNHHRDNQKFNNTNAVPEQETIVTPEDEALKSDLESAIDRAINQMPEKRGTVFKLCFIDDFTYKEAAQTLDVTRKTIENHMGLALKDMRKALSKYREIE